jgi:hypothetical protein
MGAVRTLAAIVTALAVVPAATAAKPPLPIRYTGIQPVRNAAPLAKRQASCAVHSQAKTKLGKVSRKILPVACEQPPRVKIVGASGGLNPIFGP